MPSAIKTPNIGLNQWAGNEYLKRQDFVDDNAIIDSILANTAKFETAGGTGTAISITGLDTLTDGVSKTFIASANNGGAATTINTKPLYKPGTTTTPNLVAGKAYTVWYDIIGDCFFIKASATGNATADKVLAPYRISNDEDTDIVGTMPNNGTVIITPNNLNQAIALGYHNGQGYVAGDADLISANIKAGTNIFGVAGNTNVVDTSVGDAVAGDILSGKKVLVKGALVTGNMPIRTPGNIVANATVYDGAGNIIVTPPVGYFDGANGKVYTFIPNLIPANILNTVNILGWQGTASIGKKWAGGTTTSAAGAITFTKVTDNSTASYNYITVNGLNFMPSYIIVKCYYSSYHYIIYDAANLYYTKSILLYQTSTVEGTSITPIWIKADVAAASITDTGFTIPVVSGGQLHYWFAVA